MAEGRSVANGRAGAVFALLLLSACTAGSTPDASGSTTTVAAGAGWTEQTTSFEFGSAELRGVLTLPTSEGPHPGVVLLSGSGDSEGIRSGVASSTFRSHGQRLADHGFAVLRYDPPGVGLSSGENLIPSLEQRVEETHAAILHLRSFDFVDAESIGLQGWSQGPWVMAMTAVRYPEEVAFLVSVVGSGQSVAEQQVYGIRAQSEAAGLSSEDVSKAVLVGRLLIDWQLPQPMFEEANRPSLEALGSGPWDGLATMLYGQRESDPLATLQVVIEMLVAIRDEPWAATVYPDLYLARLENIPTDITDEDMAALQTVMATNLLTDPEDFMTKLRVPIIAFFGENDVNVDTEVSAALFHDYLGQAGNADYQIVVLPDVGHNISLDTPGYWDALSEWLTKRFG